MYLWGGGGGEGVGWFGHKKDRSIPITFWGLDYEQAWDNKTSKPRKGAVHKLPPVPSISAGGGIFACARMVPLPCYS